MALIPERDCWELIAYAPLPNEEKEDIKDWMYGEVLPSIRKYGEYSLPTTQQKMVIPNFDDPIKAAEAYINISEKNINISKAYINAEKERRAAVAKLAVAEPKAF